MAKLLNRSAGSPSVIAIGLLIRQIMLKSNSTVRLTTTKAYDLLRRLASINSAGSGTSPSQLPFAYRYNAANQRTRVNLEDGSFWIYEYDKLGQVTSGKRYWNDWTPVAGQEFEYGFDDIGNRTSTKAGGDAGGAGLRAANYSANSLNQYTSRDVPGAADLLGIAHVSATVTVNGQSPYRRGEYFRQEASLNNASAAVWQSVTNIASLTGTNQTNIGNVFLPKTAEACTYDADGNLTSDGRWTNKWDGENRLVDITSLASGPSGSRKSLQFAYDSQGRRSSKIVSNWTGSAWTRALHELYLYDGWNLLAALNGTNQAIVKSFLWGLDLSGSMQGAGGVGGLIAFASRQSPVGTYFVAYDGNGNVMALVDGSSGSLSARYEYDPFGQTIRISGTPGTLNPVRFSSKHLDDETDFAYYGYRYLNPSAGRWLSRDPIGERAGSNLYGFVRNQPLSQFDIRGLCCLCLAVSMNPGDTVTNSTTPGPPEPGSPAPSTLWLGIQVPYTIQVFGNPAECHCRYTDSGSISGTVGGLASNRNFNRPEDTHYINCTSGIDQPGVFAGVDPHGSADYSLDYNWTGTLTCEGSLPFLVPMQTSASIGGHYSGTTTW